jgi:uncharacterized membrane protein (UPF0136 family)
MLTIAENFFFAFGAFSIFGGVMGFVRAKSRASLIAGGVSGAFLIVSAYLMTTANARAGLLLALLLSVALAGRFVPGFIKSRKVMPAGVMSALSLGGIVIAALALTQR